MSRPERSGVLGPATGRAVVRYSIVCSVWLRIDRRAIQAGRLRQAEHQVDVLQRDPGLALHQIIDRADHDQPLVFLVHDHADVAEVAAGHRLRAWGQTGREDTYERLADKRLLVD